MIDAEKSKRFNFFGPIEGFFVARVYQIPEMSTEIASDYKASSLIPHWEIVLGGIGHVLSKEMVHHTKRVGIISHETADIIFSQGSPTSPSGSMAGGIRVLSLKPSRGKSNEGKDRQPASYCGLLIPRVDPVSRPTMAGYILSFPPSVVAQFASPLIGPAGILLYAGYSGFPGGMGVVTSVAFRIHALQPDAKKWGLTMQAQWIGGGAVAEGEGAGGTVNSIQIIAGSPVKPTRLDFGVALHTMPGSEYRTGWWGAKRYDFGNPQISLFTSGEHTIKKFNFFSELIWVAIDADEGADSFLICLVGGKFRLGQTRLKVGTGIFVEQFGWKSPNTWPLPPIISLTFTL